MKKRWMKLGCLLACVTVLGVSGVPVMAEETPTQTNSEQTTTAESENTTEQSATEQTATTESTTEQSATEQETTGTVEQEVTDAEELDTTEEEEVTEEEETQKIVQKAQKISVKTASKTYTSDKFKTSKQTFNIGASAKTALTYKVTAGKKYVTVNKSGLVTVNRWTPKGTYKVLVTAKATDKYKKATKTVTIKVTAPKKKAQMSKIKMSWDLKPNKTINFSKAYLGMTDDAVHIKKNCSLKLTDYKKVKTANGKKYKITGKIQFTNPTDFTQEEILEILRDSAEWGDGMVHGGKSYLSAVDYQTGENLETSNSYGVKMKLGTCKESGSNKFTHSSGGWLTFPQEYSYTFSITYPIGYHDLCILAGGYASGFGEGNPDFVEQTGSLVVNDERVVDKSSCHGMRVK